MFSYIVVKFARLLFQLYDICVRKYCFHLSLLEIMRLGVRYFIVGPNKLYEKVKTQYICVIYYEL